MVGAGTAGGLFRSRFRGIYTAFSSIIKVAQAVSPAQLEWRLLKSFSDFLLTLGPWGVVLLSFLDSAGLPVGPGLDTLLIFLAAKRPDLVPLNVLLAVAGSVGGNLVLYFAARKGGERFVERATPSSRLARFRCWFASYGLLTIFIPALIPIPMPMKPFVALAGAFRTSLLGFFLCVAIARILRYGGLSILGAKLGEQSW